MKVTCQNCKRELQMPQCAPGTMLVCHECKQWTQVPTSSAEQWFMASGKQKLGPFSLGQLKLQASSGKLQPTGMLLKEGAAKWSRAGEMAGLFPLGHPPAPTPATSVRPPARPIRTAAQKRADQLRTEKAARAALGVTGILGLLIVTAIWVSYKPPSPPAQDMYDKDKTSVTPPVEPTNPPVKPASGGRSVAWKDGYETGQELCRRELRQGVG